MSNNELCNLQKLISDKDLRIISQNGLIAELKLLTVDLLHKSLTPVQTRSESELPLQLNIIDGLMAAQRKKQIQENNDYHKRCKELENTHLIEQTALKDILYTKIEEIHALDTKAAELDVTNAHFKNRLDAVTLELSESQSEQTSLKNIIYTRIEEVNELNIKVAELLALSDVSNAQSKENLEAVSYQLSESELEKSRLISFNSNTVNELSIVKKEFESAKAALEIGHCTNIESINEQFVKEKVDMQSKYQNELKELHRNSQEQINKLKTELIEIRGLLKSKIDALMGVQPEPQLLNRRGDSQNAVKEMSKVKEITDNKVELVSYPNLKDSLKVKGNIKISIPFSKPPYRRKVSCPREQKRIKEPTNAHLDEEYVKYLNDQLLIDNKTKADLEKKLHIIIHKNDLPVPLPKSQKDMSKKECSLMNDRLLNDEYEMFLRNEISDLNSSRIVSDLEIARLIDKNKHLHMSRELSVSQKELIQGAVNGYVEYLLECISTIGQSHEISKAIESKLTSNQQDGSKKDIYLEHLKIEVSAAAGAKLKSGYKLRDMIKTFKQVEEPHQKPIIDKDKGVLVENELNAAVNVKLKSGSVLKDSISRKRHFEESHQKAKIGEDKDVRAENEMNAVVDVKLKSRDNAIGIIKKRNESQQKPKIGKETSVVAEYDDKMIERTIQLKPNVFNDIYSTFFPAN
jgi:hypothetical protein